MPTKKKKKHPYLGHPQLHDSAHVTFEAHVQHPVGLVEDEELDVFETEVSVGGEVHESAGRGHEDIAAVAHVAHLKGR